MPRGPAAESSEIVQIPGNEQYWDNVNGSFFDFRTQQRGLKDGT